MRDFDYCAPTTIEEAIAALVEYDGQAKVLAGGTDLLVQMKHGQKSPRCLVNIKRIPGLRDISYDPEDGLRLGALVTLNEVIRSPLLQQHYPVLPQTAATMAGVQIRNLGTVGGNLCNAAPSADMAPSLIGLGAQVKLVGPGGEQIVPLEDFFTGPGTTVLQRGEIMTEIRVPAPPPGTAAVYLKHTPRRAMDIAVVGVAVVGRIVNPKITLGAVAPTPMRARRAEAVLREEVITEELLEEAARIASEECKPIDDVRSSAWYRREMVRVLTRRAVWQLVRAPEGGR
ncbi:MAG: FAD binding domain-containing protein [Anaerolineae bacterium]